MDDENNTTIENRVEISDSSQLIPEKSWTDRIWQSLVENSCFQIFLFTTYCILNLIFVSSIIVGPFYIGKCPICPNIPIWQIVYGSSGLVSSIFYLIFRFIKLSKNIRLAISLPIELFSIGWFIAGNIWLFDSISSVNFSDNKLSNYCDPAIYTFCSICTILMVMPFSICYSSTRKPNDWSRFV